MSVTSDDETLTDQPDSAITSGNGKPVMIEPDLEFIEALTKRGGGLFKKCMQCGTCSGTCAISPDFRPFPGKEMAWASWGMKNRLLHDPDVWLCYQCNDCSARCPRGARPGDVLAAIRQQSVIHYAFPGFLGKWVSQPQSVVFLMAIPIILITLLFYLKTPIEKALGISSFSGERIIISYSSMLPHWLIDVFFFLITALVIIAIVVGVKRFWRDLKALPIPDENVKQSKSIFSCFITTLKNIIIHKNFDKCTTTHTRFWSHMCVFFGFIALTMVTLWVITSSINPLIKSAFVYPFGFWSPWKILANLGGLAVLTGLSIMTWERFREKKNASLSTYFDWALIAVIFIVTLTGFATEVLHYVRLEPHRHLMYFVHLVFICALILYLPYSKLAHIIYRTVALVYCEYSGRKIEAVFNRKQ